MTGKGFRHSLDDELEGVGLRAVTFQVLAMYRDSGQRAQTFEVFELVVHDALNSKPSIFRV